MLLIYAPTSLVQDPQNAATELANPSLDVSNLMFPHHTAAVHSSPVAQAGWAGDNDFSFS